MNIQVRKNMLHVFVFCWYCVIAFLPHSVTAHFAHAYVHSLFVLTFQCTIAYLLLLVDVILLGTHWDPFCCGDSFATHMPINVRLYSTARAIYAVCAGNKCIHGITVFIASMNLFCSLAGDWLSSCATRGARNT